ncbi:Double-stranded RNA-binding domain containing protein [Parasponia andersonii]|uniref:Double-stranded RNA-binding domain containing protein n=1 Tax=Parasponia andersonii TaxID=3476 RepID=A0A2P5CLL4_PARAD|nr:Double-stranded RNA-binding domain containing protein [Parasponia andersonii]
MSSLGLPSLHMNPYGGEDDLTLKIEAIVEGCNDVCLRSVTQERTTQPLEDTSPQLSKRKRLPEAILSLQNPCQELDAVCYANNWALPTYHVNPAEGGFRANVTIKGADFDCSTEGELRSNPREARESSAALILAKLREVAAHAQ